MRKATCVVLLGLCTVGALIIAKRYVHEHRLMEILQSHKGSTTADAIVENAASELGKTRSHRAVAPLIEALQDSDPTVRRNAAESLGAIRDRRAVNPLISALQDPAIEVRTSAALALGDIKDPRAVIPLAAALSVGQNKLTISAARALYAIGDPRCVPALIKALSKPSVDPDNDPSSAIAIALGGMGAPAVEPLQRAVRSNESEPGFRCFAALALGRMKDRHALEPLIEDLRSQEESIRRQAISNLGCTDSSDAIPPLAALLKSNGSDVALRKMAVETLGQLAGVFPSAADALSATALNDPDLTIRSEAISKLTGWWLINSPQTNDTLQAVVRDGNPELVSTFYDIIIKKGYPGSEGSLIKALNTKGSSLMAEDFLNSGNSTLERAASDWALRNGFHVMPKIAGGTSPQWGSQH